MSYTSLSPVCVPDGLKDRRGYEGEFALKGQGTGEWVLLPSDVQSIAVTISFSDGGRGKVQTTTDIRINVENDNVISVDWPLGVVDSTIQDFVIPVTALRLVQTSTEGSSKLTVRAQ